MVEQAIYSHYQRDIIGPVIAPPTRPRQRPEGGKLLFPISQYVLPDAQRTRHLTDGTQGTRVLAIPELGNFWR